MATSSLLASGELVIRLPVDEDRTPGQDGTRDGQGRGGAASKVSVLEDPGRAGPGDAQETGGKSHRLDDS
jgi:hypothetical protein